MKSVWQHVAYIVNARKPSISFHLLVILAVRGVYVSVDVRHKTEHIKYDRAVLGVEGFEEESDLGGGNFTHCNR